MKKKWIEERLKIIGEPKFIKSEKSYPFDELNVGEGFFVFVDIPNPYKYIHEISFSQSVMERAWQHKRLQASARVHARRSAYIKKNEEFDKYFYITRGSDRIIVIRLK